MTEPVPAAIRQFLERVSDRIPQSRVDDVIYNLDQDEWAVAVIMLADSLDDAEAELNEQERASLRNIVESVGESVDDFPFYDLRATEHR